MLLLRRVQNVSGGKVSGVTVKMFAARVSHRGKFFQNFAFIFKIVDENGERNKPLILGRNNEIAKRMTSIAQ
jgi:hypothetical protein